MKPLRRRGKRSRQPPPPSPEPSPSPEALPISEAPKQLAGLVGKRVDRAWISPSGQLFLVRFDGGQMLNISTVEPAAISNLSALAHTDYGLHISVGSEIDGADWTELDEHCPQTPYTRALRGRRFSGIDGAVATFGNVGVIIEYDRPARWVKKAQ